MASAPGARHRMPTRFMRCWTTYRSRGGCGSSFSQTAKATNPLRDQAGILGSVDVFFFLELRTKFISDFYEKATRTFTETKRKIQVGDEPFDNPPYDESGEPPYLEEWQEADEALEFIGQACLSYVASTPHLVL